MIALLVAALLAVPSGGCLIKSPPRSRAALREFRKAHPCPITGRTTGACPGWEIDHVVPLCCKGKDAHSNLRWLSHEEHQFRHRNGIDCRGWVP